MTESVTSQPKAKKVKKGAKISVKDFWNFFKNTSALGLAIGVVMADAVNKLVTALVKGIITPFITMIIPDRNFTSFNVRISGVEFRFGDVVSGIINFIIIAILIYLFVKGILKNEKLFKYAKVKKAKVK